MEKCMIVWVPVDLLYNFEDEKSLYRNEIDESIDDFQYFDEFENVDDEYINNQIGY